MKVIVLAGGFGTRLSEYTESIPKPMVTVGGKPLLWHIMNTYAFYGHKDFYLALGYKAEIIKIRIKKYTEETRPLSDYYSLNYSEYYNVINGNQEIEMIQEDILKIVKK